MLLSAQSISKSYKLPHAKLDVLIDANLEVARGETVAIIGRSGAGKSTLLHVLGGLDQPKAGDVLIDGVSLYRGSQRIRNEIRAQKIGFVFQSYHLLPEMDIVENVFLPAMAVGTLSRRGMRERALQLLDEVGLSARARHKPMELSGGEQQRVALARALMNNPEIILADEPTGNLDSTTGQQVIDRLLDLSKEQNLALVMVTHSPEMAARWSRVLVLQEGKLVPQEE